MSAAPPMVEAPAPNPLRLVLTLTVAGLLSGLLIVGVYEFAHPMILANQEERLRRAVFTVLPGTDRMEPMGLVDGDLRSVAEPAAGEPVVYAGYDSLGAFVGYAIPGTGAGFQDDISLIFGFDPAGPRVIGMEILLSRETPGLGDKIYKDARWVNAFRDLSTEPEIEVVKGGASSGNQIDAITGATISSKAVVKIINSANRTWGESLPADPPREGES